MVVRGVVGGLAGGAVALAVAAAIYLGVNPLLESAGSPLRELQGLLWNIVPLGTVTGIVVGVWMATRHEQGHH